MFHMLERGTCHGCELSTGKPNQTAFISTVRVRTLEGRVKEIEVKRCATCDVSPCPNCKERTLNVSQQNCGRCGHSLIPRSQDGRK